MQVFHLLSIKPTVTEIPNTNIHKLTIWL